MSKKELIKEDQKELVSLEILTFREDVTGYSEDQLKEKYRSFKETFTLIDDLSQPYVIRSVIGNHKDIRSLEPELIPECDRFEVSESVQEILKNGELPVYKSEFNQTNIANIASIKEQQLNAAIKQEMLNGLKAMEDGKINPDIIKEAKGISDKVVIDIVGEEIGEALIKD
jgi:hypothetical protein